MAKLDQIFKKMMQKGASDLHLTVGSPPMFRLRGEMVPLPISPLTDDQLRALLFETMRPDQIERFKEIKDMDFSYEVPGVARFRGNVFQDYRGVGGVYRIIPTEIKTIDEMGFPKGVHRIAELRRGLVLVTGATGSGKSTTLSAIINAVNMTLQGHIITIEDPIEFVHPSKKCLITQREIHYHSKSFANALKAATREDPDVILVGEMRDYETISLALTAAELGILVFGTLHTNGAAETVDRIIDVFPTDAQQQARSMLSDSLKGVVSQLLLKTADGKGRCAVQEVLLGTSSLSSIIREGKTQQIESLLQTGVKDDMQTFDMALSELVKENKITKETAFYVARDKKKFEP
ncbi:MAG: type IV pilus twitching motility protein PilT [Deltaproteobacteria bacterium]|nr:type IV pilus twitching motility protein PilT [Deltaproteobacteria bacterium]